MAESKKGKGAKAGKNKVKCAAYRNLHTREKNKLARIRRSNGYNHAVAYATKHGLIGWFTRMYPAPRETA